MMYAACIMCRLSLQGRLDYANSIMDDIIDSADRPLEVVWLYKIIIIILFMYSVSTVVYLIIVHSINFGCNNEVVYVAWERTGSGLGMRIVRI